MKKIVLFANTAWYLYNFRLPLALTLVKHGWDVVLIAPHDKYVAELRSKGFTVIELNMERRSLNPLQEMTLVLQLRQLLTELKPDVIFNFTVKCVVLGSFAARLAGVRRRINAVAGLGSVFSSDTLSMKLLKPFVRALLTLSLAGKNARCIVQNPDDQALFLRHHITSPDHLHLIKGSGVDGDRFRPVVSAPCSHVFNAHSATKPRILFASRLLKSKGVGYFINAAGQMGERYEFCIAGQPDPGNPESLQQQDLDQLGNRNITLLGHVDDMAALLQSMDLVVLPSLYGEGVPRILVEAAASGLPAIAFDAPGCREIIQDGHNGYLVEPGNQQALNTAIASAFTSSDHYQAMASASREHFLSQFEQQTVISATISTINLSEHDSQPLHPATSSRKQQEPH